MSSFKPEVQTDSTGQWYSNACRFATEPEATFYVIDLADRWTAVRQTRVIEVDEPPTYVWVNGSGALPLPEKVKTPADIDALLKTTAPDCTSTDID